MNFFKLYIGDYQRDTGTLTLAEHGAYMLMLQHLYATERPLPTGRELHRLLRAETKAERDAIDRVAERFWRATPDGLVNDRAQQEIQKGCVQREVNREVGRRGGRPPKAPPETDPGTDSETDSVSVLQPAAGTDSETDSVSFRKPNRNPNQTPDTRHTSTDVEVTRAARARPPPRPDGVSEQTWADWQALRRSKRAPVTATVLAEAEREAGKARLPLEEFLRAWCVRGSQGLQAEWLRPSDRPAQAGGTSRYAAAGRSIFGAGASAGGVVDVTPR